MKTISGGHEDLLCEEKNPITLKKKLNSKTKTMVFTERTIDSPTLMIRKDDQKEHIIQVDNHSGSNMDFKAEPSVFDNRSTVDLKNELANLGSFLVKPG